MQVRLATDSFVGAERGVDGGVQYSAMQFDQRCQACGNQSVPEDIGQAAAGVYLGECVIPPAIQEIHAGERNEMHSAVLPAAHHGSLEEILCLPQSIELDQ